MFSFICTFYSSRLDLTFSHIYILYLSNPLFVNSIEYSQNLWVHFDRVIWRKGSSGSLWWSFSPIKGFSPINLLISSYNHIRFSDMWTFLLKWLTGSRGENATWTRQFFHNNGAQYGLPYTAHSKKSSNSFIYTRS